jgi:signal transduction histidine kinase
MRLRTLLSLSHTAVVATFILAFLLIFFFLTRPPRRVGEPLVLESLTAVLRAETSPQELALALGELGFDDRFTLDIFDRHGNRRRVLGDPEALEVPGFMPQLFSGKEISERDRRLGRHVDWVAIDLEEPRSHVIRLSTPRGRDQFFAQVRRNIALACSIAFFAVLAVALLLSRALAAPIRNLANFADRFGREGYELRSEVKGPAELRELSGSFNRMAAFIETNTTELKEQKEKAERTEALRREFLSDISHNLRTPLTAIMGWNDALIDGVADDKNACRQKIRREVLHVTKTVQRLLELSRWEQAKPVLLLEPVPLAEILMEVAENLQETAEATGVTLSFEGLSPDIHIQADRQKARDILQILLENVVAHAGKDVHAKVSIESTEKFVALVIQDNGVGFPDTFSSESDLERGASEVGRACLGLAIASRLVAAHDGELVLENGPDGGATARFSFLKA